MKTLSKIFFIALSAFFIFTATKAAAEIEAVGSLSEPLAQINLWRTQAGLPELNPEYLKTKAAENPTGVQIERINAERLFLLQSKSAPQSKIKEFERLQGETIQLKKTILAPQIDNPKWRELAEMQAAIGDHIDLIQDELKKGNSRGVQRAQEMLRRTFDIERTNIMSLTIVEAFQRMAPERYAGKSVRGKDIAPILSHLKAELQSPRTEHMRPVLVYPVAEEIMGWKDGPALKKIASNQDPRFFEMAIVKAVGEVASNMRLRLLAALDFILKQSKRQRANKEDLLESASVLRDFPAGIHFLYLTPEFKAASESLSRAVFDSPVWMWSKRGSMRKLTNGIAAAWNNYPQLHQELKEAREYLNHLRRTKKLNPDRLFTHPYKLDKLRHPKDIEHPQIKE